MTIIDIKNCDENGLFMVDTMYLKGSVYWLWGDNDDMELIIVPGHKFVVWSSSNDLFKIDNEHQLFSRCHGIMKEKTGAEIIEINHNAINSWYRINLENANDGFLKILNTGEILNDTRENGTGGRMSETRNGRYGMAIPICKLGDNEIRFMKMSMT